MSLYYGIMTKLRYIFTSNASTLLVQVEKVILSTLYYFVAQKINELQVWEETIASELQDCASVVMRKWKYQDISAEKGKCGKIIQKTNLENGILSIKILR